MELSPEKGSYILIFWLEGQKYLSVGKLGPLEFPAGIYIYCGSARGAGGIQARIKHHAKISARPFWHVDYVKNVSKIMAVGFEIGSERLECTWAGILENHKQFQIIRSGFGSSDCLCTTHFYYTVLTARQIFAVLKIRQIVNIQQNGPEYC